ncbi:hypothetical protein SAMN05443549_104238 [Flavobacterium fluvii]|uniref:Uncharacterized protein n=1 Tax=Flavobacterium fluvii TaxID=468056 RepID=A0A1M5KAR0_9FLAO|nr:hypothetical protein [Flavobacterium fluvii]SHG49720.1 hypothetical protein SAMN05443549_104238 [Flavobacterium fluvii]
MKTRILFLMLFIASYGFSQTVNDYKGVIIPMRYDLQKSENQYRLQTLTKFNLTKAGIQSFYNNEQIPVEFNDRCSLLYLDVKKENAFLITKLYITFRDCNNKIIFQSAIGKSREKEFEATYTEALNEAFKSVYALNYKYNGGINVSSKTAAPVVYAPVDPATTPAPSVAAPVAVIPAVAVPVVASKNEASEPKTSGNTSAGMLYAQPTSYGYQLIDSEPKVVMKVYKTSNPASYMAKKGDVQGALVSKDNQWFFEYYQGDKLISEKIDVKF